MAHRINERNTGHWSVNGEPKKRRQKPDRTLSATEKNVAAQVLEMVIDGLHKEDDLLGHFDGLMPLKLSSDDMALLSSAMQKLSDE